MITKRFMLGVAAVLLSGASQLPAQDYLLYFESGVGGPAGSEQTISCLLDMPTATAEIAGWSIGICHDEAALNPVGAVDGATTLTINSGSPPDFDQINVIPNGGATDPDTPGVNQAVVIAFLGGVLLPAGTDYELLEITYELSGPDTLAPVSYCDTTPGGAFAVETVVTTEMGVSVEPDQEASTIEIGGIFPPVLQLSAALTADAGTTTDAPVTLDNPEFEIYVFSFGVAHDGNVVTLVDITTGSDTASADFFLVDADPSNGDGGVVAAILSTAAPLQFLGPGSGYEVAIFQYEVAPTAAEDDVSALSFTDALKAEPESPPVELLISFGDDGMTPDTSDGSIIVTSAGGGGDPQFIRGDTNGDGTIDIADPVFNLTHQFLGGVANCLKAHDANDDGGIDVADPVYNLAAQFTGGPAVPAPSSCGIDPTADTLTCEFPSCP